MFRLSVIVAALSSNECTERLLWASTKAEGCEHTQFRVLNERSPAAYEDDTHAQKTSAKRSAKIRAIFIVDPFHKYVGLEQ